MLGLHLSNTEKIGIEMDCIWLSSIIVWGIRDQRENQVFLGIKYFNPIQFKPSYRAVWFYTFKYIKKLYLHA